MPTELSLSRWTLEHKVSFIIVSAPLSLLQWGNIVAELTLLLLDNTGFTVNAFAINYDDAWKPFSISDSALLHATLCLVAQHEDLIRGSEDSSDNLYHKCQALKLINNRLLDERDQVSDASITSVAILVILEVRTQSLSIHGKWLKYLWRLSTVHSKQLQHISMD